MIFNVHAEKTSSDCSEACVDSGLNIHGKDNDTQPVRTRSLLDIRTDKVTRIRLNYDLAWIGRILVVLGFLTQAVCASVLGFRRLQHLDAHTFPAGTNHKVCVTDSTTQSCTDYSAAEPLYHYQRNSYPLDIQNFFVASTGCVTGVWTIILLLMNSEYSIMSARTTNPQTEISNMEQTFPSASAQTALEAWQVGKSETQLDSHTHTNCPDAPAAWREFESIILAMTLAGAICSLLLDVIIPTSHTPGDLRNMGYIQYTLMNSLIICTIQLSSIVTTLPYVLRLDELSWYGYLYFAFLYAASSGAVNFAFKLGSESPLLWSRWSDPWENRLWTL